ncbi:hypothetical protein A5844_002144 [Enterococcus sp. 10A9_DIV0425]|uniref:Competence protein CoiA-like family protein n=1 Tax=Candidatus Enterococcus wittei TaxID=1987383 RepID=A0A242JYP3_9ENTE|nr:competence protein CoiA family protein [Enterococcus sp. 10A9_DIV0425]OTP10444.1 hypothetical protein A5844_002144 [Enterococcus sp. 10A9_DIV0425]THE14587.1 hypothetical protein E1H99_04505 [Enterococcus hirae]
MLWAKNQDGILCLATEAVREAEYSCPSCFNKVLLRRGKHRFPHFSHQKILDCHTFSESESEEHLQLKILFFQWLNRPYHRVEMEAYLKGIMQRPDILYGKHVFEIQCSELSFSRFVERTVNYRKNDYVVWWLLGSAFFQKKARLTKEKKFCSFDLHRQVHFWQVDWVNQKIILYNQVKENLEGKISFNSQEWSFFDKDLLAILTERNIVKESVGPMSNTSKDWLAKQLLRKRRSVLHLQEQCYLREKHLLFLDRWIYQDSHFFFFFKEKVFLYRLLFGEEKEKYQSIKSSFCFLSWHQKIWCYKQEWGFPLIDEWTIYQLFYEECVRLYG